MAVTIFINGYFFGNILQNTAYRIASKPGVFSTDNLPGLSRFTTVFFNSKTIIEENAKLKEENNAFLGQLAELDSLRRENQILRDGLGVARRLDSPLLLIKIFNIQKSPLYSTAMINKGSKDGVKKSLPLIASSNVLVGIIDHVFDDSAVVFLLDDPRVQVSGRVLESNVLVQTKGSLQNSLSLELATNGDEVKEGDTVVTNGLDGLPESLLVAGVTQAQSTSSALFKTIRAKPLFDLSLGSSLFVILQ